jgi:DNA-binding MarR family transcriptional regulator
MQTNKAWPHASQQAVDRRRKPRRPPTKGKSVEAPGRNLETPLDRSLPFRLGKAAFAIQNLLKRDMERSGLKVSERRVLWLLKGGPLPQARIAAETGLDSVAVSRAVIALGKRRLVRRAHSGWDRRAYAITLTEAGHQIFDDMAPSLSTIEHDLLEGLSVDEIALFKTFLRSVQAAAEKALEPAQHA